MKKETVEKPAKRKKTPVNERFIIWGVRGTTNPKVVFGDLAEAESVASVMASRHHDDFFVCKLVSCFREVVHKIDDVSAAAPTGDVCPF